MTETTGAVANMRWPEELERVGSVGQLVEFMEAKIVDHVTQSLPFGHQGEFWLRGPSIMKDIYLNLITHDSRAYMFIQNSH